jgi:LuxR family transcriptional regulator, maltose regulon positive regulatory protein
MYRLEQCFPGFMPKRSRLDTLRAMTRPRPNRSAPPGVPRALTGELKRPHLIKQLETSLDARAVLCLAPSGFGKTTLLAQYARKVRGRRVVWVTLYQDDADAMTLDASVVAAVRLGLEGVELPAHDARLAAGGLPERLGQALADDLNRLDHSLDLVLDRIEFLGESAARWVEALVSNLLEGHRVLMAGYDPPTVPVTRWLARGDAVVLGVDELGFSATEVKAFFGSRHADALAGSLEVLAGWPAGLALLLREKSKRFSPTDLMLERLEDLPEDLRVSIPDLAVLEEWSEAAAVALGSALPAGWLKTVLAEGWLLTPLGSGRFGAHGVLLEALEVFLQRNPVRHREVHLLAGSWALRDGNRLRALKHFVTAQAFPDAVSLAFDLAKESIGRSDFQMAFQVLQSVPEQALTSTARLHLAWAQIEISAVDAGERELRTLLAEGHSDPLLHYLLAYLEYKRGRYEIQLAFLSQGLSLNPNLTTQSKMWFSKTLALLELRRTDEARNAAQEAVRIAEQWEDLGSLAKAFVALGRVNGELGLQLETERAYGRALEICDRLGLDQRKFEIYQNLANLLADWDKPELALEYVNRGLSALGDAVDVWRAWLLGTRAFIHYQVGSLDLAIENFQASLMLAPQFGIERFAFEWRLWLADSASLKSDFALARVTFQEAQRTMPADTDVYRAQIALSSGILTFCEGELERAARLFEQANSSFLVTWDQVRARVYLAEIAARQGKLEQSQVDAVFSLLDEMGHDAALMTDARVITALPAACLLHGWYAPRWQTIQKRLTDLQLEQPVRPRLQVRTLGQVQVTISDQPVQLPLKRCTELLVWLALNGRGTRAQLVDVLFDGSRRAADVEHFKVIVRQLRMALSDALVAAVNPVVFENGLYALHPDLEVELDAGVLLQDGAEQTVMQVYAGEFLPDFDSEWVLSERMRLTDRAVNLLLLEARNQVGQGQLDVARLHFQRVIDLDALREEGFTGLIAVLEQMGRQDTALMVRSQFESITRFELLN